jgi:hypothetical protein
LTKEPKTHDGERTASSTNAAGKLDIHRQKTEIRSLSFTLYQNQLKWIKDLNIRPETLKQLKEAVYFILEQIRIRNDFLNRAQKEI